MRTLVTTLLVLGMAACQAPEPTLTEAERAEIESALLSAQADLYEACSTLVVEACHAPYDDDLVWINNGRVYDLASGMPEWGEWAAGNQYQKWIDRTSEVTIYSPTTAMVTTVAKWFVVDTLGVQSDTMAYASSDLWMKKAGEWKIIHEHENQRPIE